MTAEVILFCDGRSTRYGDCSSAKLSHFNAISRRYVALMYIQNSLRSILVQIMEL